MSTKALFLDLDGTLLNDRKEITPRNFDAIQKALKMGHKVIICTGRPLLSAIKQAEKLGMTGNGCYLAAFNGGILYDMGSRSVISSVSIPLPTVCAIFEEANRRGLHVQTYDHRNVLVEKYNDNENVRRYCSTILMEYRVLDSLTDLEQPPAKILIIDYKDQASLSAFGEWVTKNYAGKLDTFFSCAAYLEVVTHGLNKGTALFELSRILGIPAADTIAAGDEANDLPMIRAAGVGVAMCNGIDEAKGAADYITVNDNNNDGIAEIIEKFML